MDVSNFASLPEVKPDVGDKYLFANLYHEARVTLKKFDVPKFPEKNVASRTTHLYVAGINREKSELVVGNCVLEGTNTIHKPYAISIDDIVDYQPKSLWFKIKELIR